LLERSTNSSLLGIAFRARDRSGALMHMLNPNSGVQGCPKPVLGFLIQNSASATKDYCVLRSQNRSRRAEHLDHEIFLKDTAYLAPDFRAVCLCEEGACVFRKTELEDSSALSRCRVLVRITQLLTAGVGIRRPDHRHGSLQGKVQHSF
jgi:hypothetical protein